MAATAASASTHAPSTHDASSPAAATPSTEERWAAWQARGAAHDRAMRRRLTFAAPIVSVVAVVLYVLLR